MFSFPYELKDEVEEQGGVKVVKSVFSASSEDTFGKYKVSGWTIKPVDSSDKDSLKLSFVKEYVSGNKFAYTGSIYTDKVLIKQAD